MYIFICICTYTLYIYIYIYQYNVFAPSLAPRAFVPSRLADAESGGLAPTVPAHSPRSLCSIGRRSEHRFGSPAWSLGVSCARCVHACAIVPRRTQPRSLRRGDSPIGIHDLIGCCCSSPGSRSGIVADRRHGVPLLVREKMWI